MKKGLNFAECISRHHQHVVRTQHDVLLNLARTHQFFEIVNLDLRVFRVHAPEQNHRRPFRTVFQESTTHGDRLDEPYVAAKFVRSGVIDFPSDDKVRLHEILEGHSDLRILQAGTGTLGDGR